MPAIVQIPRVVQDARDEFADLFANEPQRQHFAEYLTGLMVAHNKTVSGISSEFAETTDQSCPWGQNIPPNCNCFARRGLRDDQNGWFSRLQWLTGGRPGEMVEVLAIHPS